MGQTEQQKLVLLLGFLTTFFVEIVWKSRLQQNIILV